MAQTSALSVITSILKRVMNGSVQAAIVMSGVVSASKRHCAFVCIANSHTVTQQPVFAQLAM